MNELSSSAALTIRALHHRVRTRLAQEFRGPIWVQGEIASLRESRGHRYLNLVETGAGAMGSDLTLTGVCWSRNWPQIAADLAQADLQLTAGMEVRVLGQVTIGRNATVQLEIARVDTEALLGRQAAQRKRLLKALRDEGLFEANRRIPVPIVPLRIGLVSNESTDGHQDFMRQIHASAYSFRVVHAHAPMQGPGAPVGIARAVSQLQTNNVDVIAVVRGGGEGLEVFDKEPIARAIVSSNIPVFMGVGHSADRSVADEVAAKTFITPTACAQACVGMVDAYMGRAEALAKRINALCSVNLVQHERKVVGLRSELISNCHSYLQNQRQDLLTCSSELKSLTQGKLRQCKRDVLSLRRVVNAFNPQHQLSRGYSIVRTQNGDIVKDVTELTKDQHVTTTLRTGSFDSTVLRIDQKHEGQ